MAYKATIHLYVMFVAVMIIAAVVTLLDRRSRDVRSAIAWGFIGSAVGFVVAPPLAALTGLIPNVMVQLEYFTRPYLGCILPAAWFLLDVVSTAGIMGCFAAGIWFGLKRRRTHVF